MLLEIILGITIGIALGIFSGLSPGIHINLISVIILSLSPILITFLPPMILVVTIISMAITHTFLDFIPTTYLGAPNEDTSLSTLPSHRFLLKGEGYLAVKLATIGSLFGLIIIIILTPILIYLSSNYYSIIQKYIPYLLILSIIFTIKKESQSKLSAIFITLISGALGLIVLNLKTLSEPLFPMLSELFGISTLLISIKESTKIPSQNSKTKIKLNKFELIKTFAATIFSSIVTGFLPGVSTSQTAILSSSILKRIKEEYYLIIIGGINTIVTIISFIAFYSIDKARNGAVVAITKIIQDINLNKLIFFLVICLIVGGLATIITLKISKYFSKVITKINYKLACILIIATIVILTIIVSGIIGIIVLIISTTIGLISTKLDCAKTHSMSCIIIPVIFFFLL